MTLLQSSNGKTRESPKRGRPVGGKSLQNIRRGDPIPIPKGGAKQRKQAKLRAMGILAEGETLEAYNESLGLNLDESPADDLPVAEEVQIESHGREEGGFKAILSRAGDALRGEDTPKQTSKAVTKKSREEFSILVVTVVTLLVTVAKIDRRAKPNTEEIETFSEHLSGILLRHLPISSKLSADAIDIIGMMAVTATWYTRVNAEIGSAPKMEPVPNTVRDNGHKQQTPISRASPEAGAWLDNVAAKSEGSL